MTITAERTPTVVAKLLNAPPHIECPVCGVMDFTAEHVRVGWCPVCSQHTVPTPFSPDLDVSEETGMEEFLIRLKESATWQ